MECEIAEYASADEYLLVQTEYDLLFLDIELDGAASSMDGMELARRIRGMEMERQPVIIFVTGYEKYVYDAFDVGAFQYLLKPIDEHRFAEVFGRAAAQIIFEAEQKKKTLVIQYGSESRAVPIHSIYYIESRNHKVMLYLKDGELEYYEKIGRLEEELQGQISVAISGTSDPDGKIAKENAERKAKEKKAAEEKAAERRKEKKAEEEKAAERRAERKEWMEGTFTVSATGTDIKSVIQNIIAAGSGTSSSMGSSFDIKA